MLRNNQLPWKPWLGLERRKSWEEVHAACKFQGEQGVKSSGDGPVVIAYETKMWRFLF